MFRIFNERKYILNYISKGFQDINTLTSDMKLYVCWLKFPKEMGGEGHQYSKSQCQKMLVEKLNQLSYYSTAKYAKEIKRVVNNAWKRKYPLLDIETIPVTYATMDWFRKQGMKKNEIKLLFTIYMGYRIKQLVFKKEYAKIFSIKTDRFFLRGNSNIVSSASIIKMMYTYQDKGWWQFASAKRGSKFIINFDEIPELVEAEKNISPLDHNFTTEELHDIGNTLYLYYDEHKVCLNCGKLIENVCNKRYCEDCAEKRIKKRKEKVSKKLYEAIGEQDIICEKCGKSFVVGGNSKRMLCDECYKDYRREKIAEAVRKNREKKDM